MNLDEVSWRERAIRDAVLAGDASAWKAWFDEHFDNLNRYAHWRCGGLADLADDVVQQTWMTAVRRLRSFDPAKGAFFDWLSGIAANAARNAIRTRRRRESRTSTLRSVDNLPADQSDPVDAEKAERVAVALAAIPEHYEAVLRAKYLDQLSVERIAAERSESAKAVESLLTHARQAFREAYRKANDD